MAIKVLCHSTCESCAAAKNLQRSDDQECQPNDKLMIQVDRVVYATEGDNLPMDEKGHNHLQCYFKPKKCVNNVVRWFKLREAGNWDTVWDQLALIKDESTNRFLDRDDSYNEFGLLSPLGELRDGLKAHKGSDLDLGVGGIDLFGLDQEVHNGTYICEVESDTEVKRMVTQLIIESYVEKEDEDEEVVGEEDHDDENDIETDFEPKCYDYQEENCPLTICYHGGYVNNRTCTCDCPKDIGGKRCQYMKPKMRDGELCCEKNYGLGVYL